MIIYGAAPSPFYRKVAIAFEEKGIAYDRKDLAPFPKTAELLRMHPMGKIPILEHDGAFVPDSSVICAYVERLHPTPALYPADAAEYAQALFLEEYADTKLVDVVGGIFFEHFVKPNVFKQETDEARVEQIVADDLPPALDYLEGRLEEGSDTLLGAFSIADVAIGAHLGGLDFSGMQIDASRWPKLAKYVAGLFARPSFKKAMGNA